MIKIVPAIKKFTVSNKKTIFFIFFLILLLVTAVLILGNQSSQQTQNEVVTYSTDKPSEEKPKEEDWQGAPDDPKKIIIQSVGIDGLVQKVGVDQNKEVAVPNNIYMAGWFVDTVKPGQKGLSILDGHVDGSTVRNGVFANLPNVKTGDTAVVEFGDGSTKQFKVLGVKTVNEEDATSVLFSQNPKVSNQLNLITCIGNFNKDTKRYDKRVIVSTELER